MAQGQQVFANFTSLDDKGAKKLLEKLRDLVIKGEHDRQDRVEDAKKYHDFWMNDIWSDAEIQEFFEELDLTPYEFAVQRPLVNNLISRQRNRRISFDFVPTDIHSYKRHRHGREKYVQKYGDRHESPQAAREYYDKYGDDDYAQAVSTLLHNTRVESKAKHTESEVFQEGLITGLDFFKAVYSRKHNDKGGIEITRRPQRAVFYDETSTEYDLSDIEYIGEVQLLYKSQLIAQYPSYKEEIEELFEEYSNLEDRDFVTEERPWETWYNFEYSTAGGEGQARIAEIWFMDTEERLLVENLETGESRMVKHGMNEEEVLDKLLTKTLADLRDKAQEGDQEAINILNSDAVREQVASLAREKYEIKQTYDTAWYKAVFSYNALFELKRSPLPHGSHPYYPFFAQYSEGDFTSLMADIEDVIIAINRALAIRELMMAHGSKNLLVVDKKAMAKSDYSIDEIAEQWTSIGGVIALEPRDSRGMDGILESITTVGEGLPAINQVLADLDNRLYQISGVNLAQLGITERETTSSGYRQQLSAGERNNGLLFDNFIRSMEGFYAEKVVPLVLWLMDNKQQKVIRSLSEEYKPWIEIGLGEDFELFKEAMYDGQYSMALKPKEDNQQIAEQRSAKYMELAMSLPNQFPLEVALEYSTDPDRHKIIKRIKEAQLERARRQAAMQVDIRQVQQIAQQTGLKPDVVEDLITNLQKEKAKQMERDQQSPDTGQATQAAQGAPTIRREAQGGEGGTQNNRPSAVENETQQPE